MQGPCAHRNIILNSQAALPLGMPLSHKCWPEHERGWQVGQPWKIEALRSENASLYLHWFTWMNERLCNMLVTVTKQSICTGCCFIPFFQIHYCSFDCSFAVPRCISVPTGGSCLFFGADGRWRAGEVAFASPGQAPCPQVDMQIECTQAIAMIYFSVCAGQASAGNSSWILVFLHAKDVPKIAIHWWVVSYFFRCALPHHQAKVFLPGACSWQRHGSTACWPELWSSGLVFEWTGARRIMFMFFWWMRKFRVAAPITTSVCFT